MKLLILLSIIGAISSLSLSAIHLSVDYFLAKHVKLVTYFSCDSLYQNKLTVQEFNINNVMASVAAIDFEMDFDITHFTDTSQWGEDVGLMIESSCLHAEFILIKASKAKAFDAEHIWLIHTTDNDTTQFIETMFGHLNLSVNCDVTVASGFGENYTFTDVFNFGRIQGNGLEVAPLGSWSVSNGLTIDLGGFKYYRRWDFHNLTLRAISVMDERQAGVPFSPELLRDAGYTPGIAAMTKITSQLLYLLSERHNFRFNYSVANRWIGSPERNTTVAVTNSLLLEEQDVSSTCARIFPLWLSWVDICFPPVTYMETKFYYLILDKGVGDYENRFVRPLSDGVWGCALAAGALCCAALAAAARLEARPRPGSYAFFSVSAAFCQQVFEDGVQEKLQSQGRRLTLLVVGLTSMLLYNYYTSSVVSWLLSAASPSIDGLDGLIASDLEIIFEDIGYTRGWLDGQKAGFSYYYSGYVNLKEDKLREKKVTSAKRTVGALQSIDAGLQLIRSGGYAYHTEPYTARQAIARTFTEDELCGLGELQMMLPASVYVMVQKRSPYKQFFVWSLMRLTERGLVSASRARFSGALPACSGRRPRALALGQAAPAFLLLFEAALLSVFILLVERIHYKSRISRGRGTGEQKRPFVL